MDEIDQLMNSLYENIDSFDVDDNDTALRQLLSDIDDENNNNQEVIDNSSGIEGVSQINLEEETPNNNNPNVGEDSPQNKVLTEDQIRIMNGVQRVQEILKTSRPDGKKWSIAAACKEAGINERTYRRYNIII